MKHFIGINDLEAPDLRAICERAFAFKNNSSAFAAKFFFASQLFFENSTRTKMSFEIALKKLGAQVIAFDPEKSSLEKGESLEDTLLNLEAMGIEIAVIRHSDDHLVSQSLKKLKKLSVINAGAGKKEHPSQAILDVMTIMETGVEIKNLHVCFFGDVLHSRVAKSTSLALKKLGAKIFTAGPDELADASVGEKISFETALKNSDVLIFLRTQLERHEKKSDISEYQFGINEKNVKLIKPSAVIMHPGPINHGVEMTEAIMHHPQSLILKQVENGVYARMSILNYCRGYSP
jgi:aspartate carbamoyltransferase catalytic subunit